MFVTKSYCLVKCDETEEIAFTYFKVKSKATALQVKKNGVLFDALVLFWTIVLPKKQQQQQQQQHYHHQQKKTK